MPQNTSNSGILDASKQRLEADEMVSPKAPGFIRTLIQLARRKWIIAKISGMSAILGLILGFVLPARYTASTTIMPPQQTPSTAALLMNQIAGSGASSIAAAAGAGLGLKNPNEIYLGLLRARPVADAILHRFSLPDAYRVKDMTAGRKILAERTNITLQKSGLITISVSDRDRGRAADIANAYTVELRSLTKSLAVTEASQRRLFYENQLKQAKEALVGAEVSFQQLQQKKGLVALEAQSKAMIESLTALRAQIAAKQVELQAVRSFSTDNNPRVQLAEKELSALQAEAARLQQRKPSPEFASLSLGDVSTSGLDYLRAQHEFMYQQALYDLLIKQYDAARLDEAKEAAVIQVVEPAIPPERKSAPHRGVILLWFTMLGVVGSCAYVLTAEHVRQDAEVRLSLTELRSALLNRPNGR